MERSSAILFPMRGDLSFGIECTEVGEQLFSPGPQLQAAGSEPGQLGWIGCAPEGQFKAAAAARSASSISGGAAGSQRLVLPQQSQSREQTPGSSDRLYHGVARQESWVTRMVSSLVSPDRGSKRGTRSKPASITMRIPSIR